MREGRREWECDLRDDGSRWEPTHVTKHSPRISPYSTYTKSGIEEVQVTSLHHDPIGVDNRSLGVEFNNNIKYKRNYIIKMIIFCHMTQMDSKE